MVSQILMTVIPAHVRTMEHVLTVWATTLVLAYLDLKEKTAPLVSINEQPWLVYLIHQKRERFKGTVMFFVIILPKKKHKIFIYSKKIDIFKKYSSWGKWK